VSSEYIFTMYRVDKFYGPERQVLSNISLSFLPGAKIGVLGANGAGKSTVLRIMAGKEEPSSGTAELAKNATVGLLEQEPELDPKKTVRENVEDGVREVRDLLDRFNAISAQFSEPDADFDALLAEQATVQDQIDRRGAWELESQLDHAMDALRLPEGDRDVTSLSGGERRRVALCRLLLSSPDLLLLDEPTNHLDAESVFWLERFLADYKSTVVAVTHDRYFLDNVAGWILELDRGKGIPYEGNYSGWLEQKSARLAIEEKQSSARQRTLRRELEWVRLAPKGRHAKSKARLGAYEKLLADEDNVKLDQVEIHIPPGPRLGDVVIEANDVSKGFGDRLLFENLTFSLPPAGIVGVIGPNGAGKTTLFRMIAGHETPDSGSLKVGETVQLKKAGTTFKGLCPFHGEKTPSFTVTPSRDSWKCFGCGLGGDVFSFVMQRDGVTFPDALRTLAAKAGVEIDERTKREDIRRARLREVLETAIAFYHQVLTATKQGEPALAYLRERGFTDETIETFQLGWAPDGWDVMSQKLVEKRGMKAEELVEVGIASPGRSQSRGVGVIDKFRKRVLFPIRDQNGDGDLTDELLSNAGLPFDVQEGSLTVNMTNRSYTQVGCGVSVGANGEVWIVQNFYR